MGNRDRRDRIDRNRRQNMRHIGFEEETETDNTGSLNTGTVEVLSNPVVKPGHMTTEFWLCVLGIICTFTLLLMNRITVKDVQDLWPLFASIGAYALSRGAAKKS